MSAALEVRALTKRFRTPSLLRPLGAREVLHGIDLSLERGKLLGLVGPNGSGKSTLLRLIAGVERPTAGTIAVLGATPADSRARTRIGFLAEGSPFPGELGPLAALDLLLSLREVRKTERRRLVQATLERIGLAPHAKRRLDHLSLGMRRRFGLGCAFAGAPELVLLDEPTAGLDAPGHILLHGLLEEARARGAAIVVASHAGADLAAVDRIAVLVEGQLVADGAPSMLLERSGRIALECEGIDSVETLRALVREGGGEVCSVLPPSDALLQLYRDAQERSL